MKSLAKALLIIVCLICCCLMVFTDHVEVGMCFMALGALIAILYETPLD